jgi:ADP-heptose:LPS heptosyltransferase
VSMVKKFFSASLGWAMGLERLLGGQRLLADPGAVESVVVLEYMLPLGCVVHMTPVFEAIKAERPEVRVCLATWGLGAALHRHNPSVDAVIRTPDCLKDTLGAASALRRELQRLDLRPDCVLTGASDQRSRVAVMGMLSRVGWRGGFTRLPKTYQRALEYDKAKSLIDNNLQLATLAGCSSMHREPRVYFSPEDVTAAEALLQEANPAGRPLMVLVTQNSGGQRTGWHAERFVEVIRYASNVLGCSVVYVGTEAESQAVEALRIRADGIGTSVTGRTSVTVLAALLAMSDAVLSLDTGTMHVGRAVEVPMVVIGPSWQRPTEWLPLGVPQVKILRGEDRDDIPNNYQLDEVQAEDVKRALQDLMEAYPASAEARARRVAKGLSQADHFASR